MCNPEDWRLEPGKQRPAPLNWVSLEREEYLPQPRSSGLGTREVKVILTFELYSFDLSWTEILNQSINKSVEISHLKITAPDLKHYNEPTKNAKFLYEGIK